MSRPKEELLSRVRELQGGKVNLQKNLEIKKVLLAEKIDIKEIEKALTAATFEKQARNFMLAPIMGIIGSVFLIIRIALIPAYPIYVALIFSLVNLVIILYFYFFYKKEIK